MISGLKLIDSVSGKLIISGLEKCQTRIEETVGLLGRSGISENEGLFIPGCRMIHTFFMKFCFDAVYVDNDLVICKIVKNLMPWRISGCMKASGVLELGGGISGKYGMKCGDKLVISPKSGVVPE